MNLAKFIFDLAFDAGARAGRETKAFGGRTMEAKRLAWEEYVRASNNQYPSRDLCPELFDIDEQTGVIRYQVLNEKGDVRRSGRPRKVRG